MIKIFITLLVVSVLTGCDYREQQFNKATEEIKNSVKEACEKSGGTLVSGIEYTYTNIGDEVTVGYYCIPPSKDKDNE